MNVGIVRDFVREQIAPVQPLHGELVKPNPPGNTAQVRNNRRIAGKKFEIKDGIHPQSAYFGDDSQAIPNKRQDRPVPDGQNIFIPDNVHDSKDFAVALERKKI